MMTHSMFTLVSKNGKFATLDVSSNNGETYCNANTVTIEESSIGDVVWVVQSREHAEKVLNNPSEWYNSGLSHPMVSPLHSWQVVELTCQQPLSL